MKTLIETHDGLLLDLDGTVYRGRTLIDGAVETLTGSPIRALFVTNNASSSPDEVATYLRDLGLTATREDVVTSAQSAASLLADQLQVGARVLVVGTEALAEEVRAVGLSPVRHFEDSPVAVVQGHSPLTGWAELREAGLAIRAGAIWIATNLDRTLPEERGLVPGNGSMVAALASATESTPQVAGKPSMTIFANALSRGQFETPLVVGDRLDTDIAGAHAANLPSLLVLTGVSNASDIMRASPSQRPTYVARDLRGLRDAAQDIAVAEQPGWRVDVDRAAITITSTGVDPGADGLSVVRAVAHTLWNNVFRENVPVTLRPGDDAAWIALRRWALLPAAESGSGRVRATSGPRGEPTAYRR